MRNVPLVARFEDKFTPEPNSGCWLWTGAVLPRGYGIIFVDGVRRAHRVAWELYRGAIPAGLHVLHKCDVTGCVNPDHLFLGTHEENMRDMARKGRNVPWPGESNCKAKLTVEKVREIRASSLPTRELSAIYGVNGPTIRKIKTRYLWAGVN